MKTAIVMIALLLVSIPVCAEPSPMPKRPGGGCPYGSISSGSSTYKMDHAGLDARPNLQPLGGDQRRLGATTDDPT
jgi:hypothetical protein